MYPVCQHIRLCSLLVGVRVLPFRLCLQELSSNKAINPWTPSGVEKDHSWDHSRSFFSYSTGCRNLLMEGLTRNKTRTSTQGVIQHHSTSATRAMSHVYRHLCGTHWPHEEQ
ncbi:unnamed protein product, partial [Scytosiphon promiscuus]